MQPHPQPPAPDEDFLSTGTFATSNVPFGAEAPNVKSPSYVAPNSKWNWLTSRPVIGMTALLIGWGMGSGGSQPASTETMTAAPLATATRTVTAEPRAVPTVTVTATKTATATATVTATATATATITVEAQSVADNATRGTAESNGLSGAVGLSGTSSDSGSASYYANCSEAKAAGVAPLRVGDPGYRQGLDRDDDGVACE